MTEVLLRDPVKLHSLKMHLIAVCELNAETWRHDALDIHDATCEWLLNAKQTDQLLKLPITDEQIDSWLAAMQANLKKPNSGERLIPYPSWICCSG